MLRWIRDHFLVPAMDQADDVVRSAHKWLVAFGWLAVIAVGFVLVFLARIQAAPESLLWEVSVLARIALFRVPLGLFGVALATFTAVLMFKFFIRSPQGKATALWKRKQGGSWPETEDLRIAKTLNAGTVIASLFLGSLIFWALILAGK